MPQVTDPALLAQLNSSGVPTGPRPAAVPAAAPQRGGVRTVYTAPKTTKQFAEEQKAVADIADIPLSREKTTLDIREARNKPRQKQFEQTNTLSGEYLQSPAVKAYTSAIPSYATALNTPETPEGDLSLVYAFAKVSDPESVVREGEAAAVGAAAPVSEQAIARIQKEFGADASGSFKPEARKRLRDALKERVANLNRAYIQERVRYKEKASRFGLNPEDIVGRHAGEPFRGVEAKFLGADPGSVDYYGRPIPSAARDVREDVGVFGDEPEPTGPTKRLTRGQEQEYEQFLQGRKGRLTGDIVNAWWAGKGFPNGVSNADQVAETINRGGKLSGISYKEADKPVEEAASLRAKELGQAGASDLFVEGAVPFSDEIAGFSGGVGEYLSGGEFGRGYDEARLAENMRLDEARGRLGWKGTVAEGAGLVGGALLTGSALGRLPGVRALGPATRSTIGDVAFGTAAGAGQAEEGQRGVGSLIGGGAALVGSLAGNLIGGAIAPRVLDDVRALRNIGVRTTFGQGLGRAASRFESALSSIPVLGDLTAAARKRAIVDANNGVLNESMRLANLGKAIPKGAEGTTSQKFVQKAFDDGYADVRGQMSMTRDRQFLADVTDVLQDAKQGGMEAAEAARLEDIFRNKIDRRVKPGQTIDGTEFKKMSSEIGKLIEGAHRQGKYEFEDGLRGLQVAVDEAARRASPADAVAALDKLDEGYALLVIAQRASARRGGDTGLFTPKSFDAEVQRADRSIRSRAYLRGEARGQNLSEPMQILGELPTSGTTERGMAALVGTGAGAQLASPWLAVPAALSAAYAPGARTALGAIVGGDRVKALVKSGVPLKQAEAIMSAAERGRPLLSSAGAGGVLSAYGNQ